MIKTEAESNESSRYYLLGDRLKPRCCVLGSGLGDARKSFCRLESQDVVAITRFVQVIVASLDSLAYLMPLGHIVLGQFEFLEIKRDISFVTA